MTGRSRQRVLVTGGAGFIGHHLITALVGRGDAVLVIDDLSTGKAERLPDDVGLEQLDIATGDVATIVASWAPDAVFHLAAQTSVGASMRDPVRDLDVNARGTLRMLAAALASSVRRFVFVSSGGAAYGETRRPATERTPTRPSSYYGVHKLLAEQYVKLSGLSHAIARPSNVYGHGQLTGTDGAVIPAFVESVRRHSPIPVDGDGMQMRDFVHVRDVVAALLIMATLPDSGTWNVSSGSSLAIGDLADLVESAAGVNLGRIYRPRRPGDVRHSRLSPLSMESRGWTPRVTLQQGLEELVPREVPHDDGGSSPLRTARAVARHGSIR